MVIRQTVMSTLNLDFDERGDRCGIKLLTEDLKNGVGRSTKHSTVESKSRQSSSFVNSENLELK